ncbi:MAG: LLM class F420-dependent oxidoreductase [Vicinamibacteria bacterium]
MKFAVGYFPTDDGIDPVTLARMVEDRPFESLFFTDHTHIPAARETPYPAGTELPREYSRILDPFVALMAAGGATERIKLGTGVCLVVERDPIVTAKQAAGVDRLSGGRLLFGVGAGWNLEEMRNHGTDPARRFGVLRERVEAIKEIWTSEEASYHGKHVDFDRIWCWPKPLTQPHPPIIVGGHGKGVLDRVLAFGDEWMPNRIGDDAKISARIARLRQAGEDAGRGPIPTTLANATTDPDVLELYEGAGVHRALFWVAQGDEADLERRLDRIAAGIEAYESAG